WRIPNPPALHTAATSSGPVRSGPIGATTIGASIPNRSQKRVFNIFVSLANALAVFVASPIAGQICDPRRVVGNPEIEPFGRDWRYIPIALTVGSESLFTSKQEISSAR